MCGTALRVCARIEGQSTEQHVREACESSRSQYGRAGYVASVAEAVSGLSIGLLSLPSEKALVWFQV